VRHADAANGFANFTTRAGDAQAVLVAQRRAALAVHLHDRRRKTMREQWRNAADRADLSLDIVEREITLGRRIEFENPWNRKACLERLPDIAAQAIAARHPQPVLALERGGLCFQEIAAELADILEKGAIEARDVLPEMAGREFVGK